VACPVWLVVSGVMGVIRANKQAAENLKLAARALGDHYYDTGIPNTAWKRYANSFSDYKRLLYALAKSGNFTEENVKRYVEHFKGTNGNYYGFIIENEEQKRVIDQLLSNQNQGIQKPKSRGTDTNNQKV